MVANRALSRCAPGPRLLGALPRPPLGEGRAVRRRRSERKKEREREQLLRWLSYCLRKCSSNCSGKYHGKLEKQGRYYAHPEGGVLSFIGILAALVGPRRTWDLMGSAQCTGDPHGEHIKPAEE